MNIIAQRHVNVGMSHDILVVLSGSFRRLPNWYRTHGVR